jgi:GT2 family glycosyltransferase
MLTLGFPCYKHAHLARELIQSAERGSLRPTTYAVVDNGALITDIRGVTGTVIQPGRNIGVSAAWNKIFATHPDYIVISNDDVVLHKHTLERLVDAADTTDAEFLYPAHAEGAMFCVFLLKKAAYARVGPFDENFWPAYFEDNDYHRRMKLADVKELGVPEATYDHIGSASLEQGPDHHRNFLLNRAYYQAKWGGLPGHETLTEPALVAKR